jgi:hypothetical protein
MPPLFKKRRDLRFDGVISSGSNGAVLSVPPGRGCIDAPLEPSEAWVLLGTTCDICVIDDNRSGEIVLRHRASLTVVLSDLLCDFAPTAAPQSTLMQAAE